MLPNIRSVTRVVRSPLLTRGPWLIDCSLIAAIAAVAGIAAVQAMSAKAAQMAGSLALSLT